jgi:hypothetical protein
MPTSENPQNANFAKTEFYEVRYPQATPKLHKR